MQRSLTVALLVGGVLSASAATAAAHPKLLKTDPPADAVTATAPKELRLIFNEELVPKFCGIELADKSGKKVETGGMAPDASDKKQLVVPLPTQLTDGIYKVTWHAVGDDTHRVQGSYSFTVKH